VAVRSKREFNQQEIRERVNRVMDSWQSYHSFAHLLTSLIEANRLTNTEFARRFTQESGMALTCAQVHHLRHGRSKPPYRFIEAITDHAVLSFAQAHMRPRKDHRIALFAAAGLIEVTPSSTKQWNTEVISWWQRQSEHPAATPLLTWKELIRKLYSFQCQAGRWSHREIADVVSGLPDSDCQLDGERVRTLLKLQHTVPTQSERSALAKTVGLRRLQISRIETAVQTGMLPLIVESQPSAFSMRFSYILGRLRAAGISQAQLISHTVPPGQSEPELSQTCLSAWKLGKTRPRPATLRVLIKALEQCHDWERHPAVTRDEIQQLVSAAALLSRAARNRGTSTD
jgi:hypothetical protein